MLSEDCTIPFISRYRKDQTGNLDEVQIENIAKLSKQYQEIIKRKETILKTIEEQGQLSPELKSKIEKLIQSDKEIAALREQIKNTSLVQLNNGVITANDYLKEINEYDLANQSLIQHQTQLIQSKLQYQLIKGKN